MGVGKKKVLAVLLLIVIVAGWYGTLFGFGSAMEPMKDKIELGLDIKGGVYVVMEAQTDLEGEELSALMDQTKTVLENRVDQMGLANPVVTVENGNRIRVELPGVENAEEAIDTIGQTAQLQFALANGEVAVDGSHIEDATTSQDQSGASGGWAVDISFDSEGAEKFEEATRLALSGEIVSLDEGIPSNAIVIMLDGQVISAPSVNEVITGGNSQITGGFSQEEAVNLAALIRGGSLPVELVEVESSVQTAKIGFDAFEKSVVAGLIGIGFIFLIMIVGYRVMGVAASVALLLYTLIVLWAMALMGSVLTLPGIAGIILSVGMAVDANVIIFSRIKEEIGNGRTIRVATDIGFKKAMGTVLDSQVTTLIAAVILYQVGTSSVKGFAWTLMIGILASVITAAVVTQIFLGVFANSKVFAKNKLYGINEDGSPSISFKKKFSFVKHRKIFYIISIVIISVGLILGGIRGFNYGIDFTGGTMLHVDMGREVATEEIIDIFAEEGIDVEVVYSGDEREEVIIKTVTALENEERNQVTDKLLSEYELEEDALLASSLFGPSVGEELRNNAITAIVISAIGMFIYIRIRFREWKFGAAAMVGVAHDVLMVLAFYSIFQITVNNPFIAGILTVVGYSINDTIVVFDRVRENTKLQKKTRNVENLLDESINQTLMRSIMTSVTTLVVMIPLYLLTSEAIREFVLPLMVGVLVGCMSSIFIASPLYFELSKLSSKTHYDSVAAKSKKRRKPDRFGKSEKKVDEASEAMEEEENN